MLTSNAIPAVDNDLPVCRLKGKLDAYKDIDDAIDAAADKWELKNVIIERISSLKGDIARAEKEK